MAGHASGINAVSPAPLDVVTSTRLRDTAAPAVGSTPKLAMRGIVKYFGSFLANDHVDLTVVPGDIHAVVGENGAGKTTLMNILYGLIHPDEGEIVIDGQLAHIRGPRDAIAAGVGMVHQHFQLVRVMTVAENVVLGQEPGRVQLDMRRAVNDVRSLVERFGLVVEPTARIDTLPVGLQQRVEILKILYRGSNLLVFDEPTAVLTPQETDELFEILRGLVAGGKTIILITHKLNEVMAVSQQVTVLRQGRVEGVLETARTSPPEIARLMVGREVLLRVERDAPHFGEVSLELRGVQAHSDRGLPALEDVRLQVRSGEILGIAGVSGNGQLELAEVVAGLRHVTGGQVLIGGRDVTTEPPAERRANGLAYIPEDRRVDGLVLPFPVRDNLILGSQERAPFRHGWQLDNQAISRRAGDLIERFDIRPPRPDALLSALSGGNQQKVVVARELADQPKVLVAAEPSRGLDVGATEFIHQQLVAQRDEGLAILLISSELDEIFSLSDTIAVIYRGRILEVMPSASADRERIGLLMAGGMAEEALPTAAQIAAAAAAAARAAGAGAGGESGKGGA
jgi:simple sugar transport system ATP-binding protein